jgi:hypothetical protein
MMNKKLGFYTVGNLEFESKIQACLHGTKTKQPVQWNFNNKVFSTYSWHIEPSLTLDQLYDRRAKELREQYDYIIISYSGGSDSHNIVQSFIRQNLHIDEILVNTMSEGNKNFMPITPDNKTAHNAAASEHILQTVPRLNEIYNHLPNTKITVVDLTKFLFSFFESHKDASWVETKREGLNPLNVTRYNYLYFSEIRKKFDKNKKIAIILGVEKPRTFINSQTDKFYVRFSDRPANVASVGDFIHEYPNATVEYFYWSPDAVDIVCKQAHTIKKWLEINPQCKDFWVGNKLTKEVFRLVHERLLRSIIYTTWDQNWFQADKSTRDWFSEFDSWFIQGHSNSRSHAIWLEGIKYVSQNASDYINKDADGLLTYHHDYLIG